MNDSDRQTFGGLMNMLCAAFGKEPSSEFLDAYWFALDDMPIEALTSSAKRAMSEGKFMPKPFELRQLGGEVDPEATASEAWQLVMTTLERVGTYKTVDFADPCTNAAIRALGGWVRLGSLTLDELEPFERKRFVDLHVGYQRAGVTAADERGKALTGQHDDNNGGRGFALQEPVRVGEILPVGVTRQLQGRNE